MNVAILTLMHGYNYGGVLQAFSLFEALQKRGHNVEIIDFHFNNNWRKLQYFTRFIGAKSQETLIRAIGDKKFGVDINSRFIDFKRNYLKMSPVAINENELQKIMLRYDAMIVGSDQVWNLDWSFPHFFFQFVNDTYNGLLISYAACTGGVAHNNRINNLDYLLKKFSFISVRNDITQNFVRNIIGHSPEITCDPTLLVNDFSFTGSIGKITKNYILLYALSEKRYFENISNFKNISKILGLPLVCIKSSVLNKWDMADMDIIIENPGIEDWIELFKNASYVLTDSFHGTLFSLKYKIPFINYIGTGNGFERVLYIANKYGCMNAYALLDDIVTARSMPIFNFEKIHEKINQHVVESFSFLDKTGL